MEATAFVSLTGLSSGTTTTSLSPLSIVVGVFLDVELAWEDRGPELDGPDIPRQRKSRWRLISFSGTSSEQTGHFTIVSVTFFDRMRRGPTFTYAHAATLLSTHKLSAR